MPFPAMFCRPRAEPLWTHTCLINWLINLFTCKWTHYFLHTNSWFPSHFIIMTLSPTQAFFLFKFWMFLLKDIQQWVPSTDSTRNSDRTWRIIISVLWVRILSGRAVENLPMVTYPSGHFGFKGLVSSHWTKLPHIKRLVFQYLLLTGKSFAFP